MNTEAFERNRVAFEDHRRFLRDLARKHDQITRRMIAEIDDARDTIRAQTEALLKVLDRLDSNGPEQPAT